MFVVSMMNLLVGSRHGLFDKGLRKKPVVLKGELDQLDLILAVEPVVVPLICMPGYL